MVFHNHATFNNISSQNATYNLKLKYFIYEIFEEKPSKELYE